jgi:hypothetical protein
LKVVLQPKMLECLKEMEEKMKENREEWERQWKKGERNYFWKKDKV